MKINLKLLSLAGWIALFIGILSLFVFIVLISFNASAFHVNEYMTMFGLPFISAVAFYFRYRVSKRLFARNWY